MSNLTESERVILSNQFKILEKLYPDEAKTYKTHREIIDSGYAYNYEEVSPLIDKELSEEDCKEVLDILTMYSILQRSYDSLKDKKGLTIRFSGFDGNNETKQWAYTRFYIDELQKFSELKNIAESDDYNSHRSLLPKYRNMLERWDTCEDKYKLKREDIEKILST